MPCAIAALFSAAAAARASRSPTGSASGVLETRLESVDPCDRDQAVEVATVLGREHEQI
jgi:hypothetical protein